MIESFKEWIAHSVAAMLLISVVQQLIPDGTIRKVTTFLSGLILLTIMLQPISKVKDIDFELKFEMFQQEFEKEKTDFEKENTKRLSAEVEQKISEKIEQKAETYGKTISVHVKTKVTEEEIPVPERVEIEGEYQKELADWIESEWKIPHDRQNWNSKEKHTPP